MFALIPGVFLDFSSASAVGASFSFSFLKASLVLSSRVFLTGTSITLARDSSTVALFTGSG